MDHGGEVGGPVDDGRVDHLAGAAGGAGVLEGGEDADDQVEGAARVVPDQVGGDGRGLAGAADHPEGAGDGDVRDVVPGGVGQRAVLAPAGHPAVDELRVAGVAVGRADAEPLGDPGAEALDEHVGALDQVEDAGGAVGGLQVDEDGALVAVGDVVGGVDGESAAAGAVDPYDVRSQVGEEHGGERARPDARQLDDAHARERAVAAPGARGAGALGAPGRGPRHVPRHGPCHCHRAPSIRWRHCGHCVTQLM